MSNICHILCLFRLKFFFEIGASVSIPIRHTTLKNLPKIRESVECLVFLSKIPSFLNFVICGGDYLLHMQGLSMSTVSVKIGQVCESLSGNEHYLMFILKYL